MLTTIIAFLAGALITFAFIVVLSYFQVFWKWIFGGHDE